MIRIANVVSKEIGVELHNLKFEGGKTYALNLKEEGLRYLIGDLVSGFCKPENGSVYVDKDGNTDNLISVEDSYFEDYKYEYCFLDSDICLIEDLSIRDNMLLLSSAYNIIEKDMKKILKMVHIKGYDRKIKSLSCSDKYRVKIAQILYMQPSVIICDNIFKDKDLVELEEIESLLCDASKYLGSILLYMYEDDIIINKKNFDVLLDERQIVKERV